MTRQMVLVGFLQAQNCTNLPSSWRHPDSRDDSMSADYYQEIAKILEAGKFHMAFFDDRLAMPDRYGNDHAHTVEYGIRCVKMDPLIVLTTMGMVTDKLGLGATCSTTYYEPFDVARRFATLDLMSGGRAGWNVVTSLNDGEALNMGRDSHPEHDSRYDRADEFMEVVLGHWDTWEDGALIMDKKSGRFADPGQGEAARSQGGGLQVPWSLHGPALGPGPSRHHPGRRIRPRPTLCRPLGRGDLHGRAQSRWCQGRLCRRSKRGSQGWPRSRSDAPLQFDDAGLRRDQGRG
ncbi:alkanesulfonate monooxygenase SsuD/methylene tetrahydromethanopterin reductase-like flavin-dependent oxidoreductase (luciferase family) [Bradyrhizobium sp. i1.3.6]